jgi:hypothetical protein
MESAARRLTHALAILESDTVASHIPDGLDRREEARVLYRCVAHLGASVMPEIPKLSQARAVLGGVLGELQSGKGGNQETLVNAALRASAKLRDALEELRWKVGDTIDYPFEHAKDDITLGRYALPPVIPEKDNVSSFQNCRFRLLVEKF